VIEAETDEKKAAELTESLLEDMLPLKRISLEEDQKMRRGDLGRISKE
jgi:hypothetical protein